MHIGAPATVLVQVGDLVRVGTKIGESGGFVSAPVYSSVSGKVVKIHDFLLAGGNTTQAVVIESDGQMTPDEAICPPVVDSRDSFIAAVRDSGVVGLGGAGFPAHVKLNVDPARIEHLIINGAECEPYVTSDTVTMTDRREDMEYALEAMKTHLGIKHIICKAHDEVHRKVLEKLGADKVVIPEKAVADKLARSLTSHNVLDFIELSSDYGIVEIPTPKTWVGKNLKELDVRAKLGVNIIAIQRNGKVSVSPRAEFVIEKNDILVVLGDYDSLTLMQEI
jgi:electron transport complex protein RnfC